MKFVFLLIIPLLFIGCKFSPKHEKLAVDEFIISSHYIGFSVVHPRPINYPHEQHGDSLSPDFIYTPVFTIKLNDSSVSGYFKSADRKNMGYFSLPEKDSLIRYVNYCLDKLNYTHLDSVYKDEGLTLYNGEYYILIFKKGNVQKMVKVRHPWMAPVGFNVFVDSLQQFASKQKLSGIIDKNILAIDSLMKKQWYFGFPVKESVRFKPPKIKKK